jgi:hypothetical protein
MSGSPQQGRGDIMTKQKLTKQQAKRYSLIKWKHAKETGDYPYQVRMWLIKNHKKIYLFRSECGYCQKYGNKCQKYCPLSKLDTCTLKFQKWINAKTKKTCKKYATLIYNDIKES